MALRNPVELPGIKSQGKVGRVRVRTPLKSDRKHPPRPKFLEPAHAEALKQEARVTQDMLTQDRADTDRRIEALRPQIKRMEELQEKKSTYLSTDEQVIILEAYFSKNIAVNAIAEALGRNHSVVSRFIKKYTSTAPIAKKVLENSAERLARRVVSNANVQESMEVLDRLDVLPRKNRDSGTSGPKFNVFIGAGTTPPLIESAPAGSAINVTPQVPDVPE